MDKHPFQEVKNLIRNQREELKRESKIEIQNDELFQKIKENESEAWNILKYCSFLDPDFIPISIQINLFGFDEKSTKTAVDVLEKLSL